MIDLKPSTAPAVKKRFFPMEDNNFTIEMSTTSY